MELDTFESRAYLFIDLLSNYFNRKKTNMLHVDGEAFSFFLKLSKHHSLTSVLYLAIKETSLNVDKLFLDELENHYLKNIRKAVSFDHERKKLYDFLNENQIEYLPLKGIVIKEYYLDPYSREFADNDILINGKRDVVKRFFVANKYRAVSYKKGNHDVYVKTPFYNFEMHFSLFANKEDNGLIVRYFDNYLERAPLKEFHEHYLSNEDFYIYFTAHTYKHYNNSGCGIRTLIDYYLYLNKERLDFRYINKELDKLGLTDFSKTMISLSFKLFNRKQLNEDEKNIFLYLASSGTYGSLQNSVRKGISKKGKSKYLLSRIFPPILYYKSTYPWAYKCRILLPLAWFDRLVRYSKRGREELKEIRRHKSNKKISNNSSN